MEIALETHVEKVGEQWIVIVPCAQVRAQAEDKAEAERMIIEAMEDLLKEGTGPNFKIKERRVVATSAPAVNMCFRKLIEI